MIERLLHLPRAQKRLLAICVDLGLCLTSTWAAFYLRLEEWIFPVHLQWLAILLSPVIALPIFIRFGLYRSIFRHSGVGALVAVVQSCLLYGFVYAVIFTLVSVPDVPRTVGVIQPIMLFLSIGATRAFGHYMLGGNYRRLLSNEDANNVIIYGAGSSGRRLADALRREGALNVAAFVDDDESLAGALIDGVPILQPSKLPLAVEQRGVSDVLLALPSATRRRRREILEMLAPLGVTVRMLPGLGKIARGEVQVSDLRAVDIEDLLGRDPVKPDQDLLSARITGKTVLVTGGGGSIGSELCRQIIRQNPERLLILDTSEFALYSVHRELLGRQSERGLDFEIVPLLGSVLDANRLAAILAKWKPDIIFHAAAYKHVPLVEANPLEGLRNNVWGTLELARAAIEAEIPHMVLISTDKAVRPTNVMGASKRLAEQILQSYDQQGNTAFSMVRFGNVLGSSGSVVPLFREQIRTGGPITITHAEVTRYFMTIPEAAQLVIQASAMATGGDVFVLDMGEPVKIIDLARSMVELSGLQVRNRTAPDGDIEIVVVGLRPGEKLYEELLLGNDPSPTAHERISRAREYFLPWDEMKPLLEALDQAIAASDEARAIALLKILVPEFVHRTDDSDAVRPERRDAATRG